MPASIVHRQLEARHDPALRAVLGASRPLAYTAGADASSGLPGRVRSASALRRRGDRLIVVQDDVNALAVVDLAAGAVQPILLPAGEGGARVFDDMRGNKAAKLDLEASVVLPDGRLLAFGSGSSSRREHVVVLAAPQAAAPWTEPAVTLLDAGHWYALLRALAESRGAELNIEGAVIQGGRLRLVQRGHGKRRSAEWNAFVDVGLPAFLEWLDEAGAPPGVLAVLDVDLGRGANGVPFGLTDAAAMPDGRVAFLACAEDAADVRSDGPVLGCRFGWIAPGDHAAVVTDVVEADGRPTRLKWEGLESRPQVADAFDVIADVDCPTEPAMLAELRVT